MYKVYSVFSGHVVFIPSWNIECIYIYMTDFIVDANLKIIILMFLCLVILHSYVLQFTDLILIYYWFGIVYLKYHTKLDLFIILAKYQS